MSYQVQSHGKPHDGKGVFIVMSKDYYAHVWRGDATEFFSKADVHEEMYAQRFDEENELVILCDFSKWQAYIYASRYASNVAAWLEDVRDNCVFELKHACDEWKDWIAYEDSVSIMEELGNDLQED